MSILHKPWPTILALLLTPATLQLLWSQAPGLFFISVIASLCWCIYWGITHGRVVFFAIGLALAMSLDYSPAPIIGITMADKKPANEDIHYVDRI